MALHSPAQTVAPLATAAAGTAEWAVRINRMIRDQLQLVPGARRGRVQTDVLASAGATGHASVTSESIRFSNVAAELVVRQGLKAPLLAELASASGVDAKLLYEFAGIDRTTVARKAARDDILPQEVAVKALEFAELVAAAADVFGTVNKASHWLTLPHPVLDGETPMQRARTPWGLQRVRSILGALKYGGVV